MSASGQINKDCWIVGRMTKFGESRCAYVEDQLDLFACGMDGHDDDIRKRVPSIVRRNLHLESTRQIANVVNEVFPAPKCPPSRRHAGFRKCRGILTPDICQLCWLKSLDWLQARGERWPILSHLQARDAFERMWKATTIGLPSADDERLLNPDETPEQTLDRIALLGVEEIVLKQGSSGPMIWHAGHAETIKTAPASHVVDTTAAGDSFNAGYLHARLTGADPKKATLAGHTLAMRVISYPGAIIPRA